ncbi:alpha/beta fold hydrolase [Allokutzneria sp. NRRL B-24872]|uniref:alpha/beta fold hydrolase n=1 Tax=Allokutzneria sp. NRRL B-24872 TaxID=1137961 RepID=UPI000A3B0F24|nr:alpha/beta hydrolase [Allokutzneria sp. NRRL B-24872]
MSTTGQIHANGIDFDYLEDGPSDGPLALCLHGFPDHAPTFDRLLPALANAGYHAVAPWMRGYHPTGLAADGRYQSATIALDAVALVEALGRPGADSVVIGHDWGAVAASGAAVLAPQRLRGIVSMALPHPAVALGKLGGGDFKQMKRAWYMWLFQMDDAPEALLSAPGGDLVDFLWKQWSPGFRPPAEDMAPIKDLFTRPEVVRATLAYYRHTLNPKLQAPDLAEVQQQVMGGTNPLRALYIGGADDGCFSSDYLAESAAFCTVAPRIKVVDDCGHFLHRERPNAVNRAILNFLDDLR